jgi:hypothetical protein
MVDQSIEDLKSGDLHIGKKIVHYSEHLQAPAIDAEGFGSIQSIETKEKETKVVSFNYKMYLK